MGIYIWPHPAQFNVDADVCYQNWLRNDHPRELMYRLALEDLAKNNPNIADILDAGTGSGVWALTAANIFQKAQILGIDIQPKNIEWARENAKGFPTVQNRLNFEVKNIQELNTNQKYDLIITELDGGIGSNEGAKRNFKNLQRFLSARGKILPNKITVYIVPVGIDDINQKIPNIVANPFLDNQKIIIDNPYSCYYVVYGVNSGVFLSNPVILDVISTTEEIIEGYEKKFDFVINKSGKLSGFLVWFVHDLTDNIKLSSHPDEPLTTWGQAYFPIKELSVKENDEITLNFSEVITELGPLPHYDWRVNLNDVFIEDHSNKENQIRRI